MTGRSKLWRALAGLYALVNVAGAAWGAAEGDEMHMMTHIVLLLLGFTAYLGWRLARRGQSQSLAQPQLGEERIEYLQQSVDALALELERVGEAQRFADKLRVERGELPLKRDQ